MCSKPKFYLALNPLLIHENNGTSNKMAVLNYLLIFIRAVVKTTDSTRWEFLRREYGQHVKPYIQTSTYFRQIHDTINLDGASTLSPETPCCLVLEWMETTLAQLPSESYYQNPLIVYKVFEALLEGSAQLARYGQFHSGALCNPRVFETEI